MSRSDLAGAAVEVAHLARPHVCGPDRQAGLAARNQREVDELTEGFFKWCRRIEAGAFRTKADMRAKERQRIGLEEAWNAAEHCRPVVRRVGYARPARPAPQFLAAHAPPKLLQPLETVLGLIASNKARVDGADRGADDPVRLDLRLVQRLIDTGLVSAQCAAALKDENRLTLVGRGLRRPCCCGRISFERFAAHNVDHLVHWRHSAACLLCALMMISVADVKNDPTAAPWSFSSRIRPAVTIAAVK